MTLEFEFSFHGESATGARLDGVGCFVSTSDGVHVGHGSSDVHPTEFEEQLAGERATEYYADFLGAFWDALAECIAERLYIPGRREKLIEARLANLNDSYQLPWRVL
jgi:hypothetical protein